jgi:hypothetical protein
MCRRRPRPDWRTGRARNRRGSKEAVFERDQPEEGEQECGQLRIGEVGQERLGLVAQRLDTFLPAPMHRQKLPELNQRSRDDPFVAELSGDGVVLLE